MGIRFLKKHAALEGVVGVEDAEPLADWLRAQKHPAVHLGRCEHLHAAALQALLALAPRVAAPPPDPLLAALLARTPTQP